MRALAVATLLLAAAIPGFPLTADDDGLPSDPLSGLASTSDDDRPATSDAPLDPAATGQAGAADDDRPAASANATSALKAVNCPQGTYFWGSYKSKHFCVKCPAGLSSDGCNDCKPDPSRDACIITMRRCPAGKYPDDEICSACPAGKIRRMSSQSVLCNNCAKGQFQHRVGQSTCEQCSRGKFVPTVGAASCTECHRFCPAGHYPKASASGTMCACTVCTSIVSSAAFKLIHHAPL
jgi:hypothetical protein